MALTSYNDGNLETQRQSYNTFFEIGYSIRRRAPRYIISLAILAVLLPGTPLFWLAMALSLYVVDTNRNLRMQDPFGKGKGPYLKRMPGRKKMVEEWSVLSTPQHRGGNGIWPMGNNYYTNEEVVAADALVRSHMVLSGTTGSGKTVTMTSAFAYTSFVASSGMCMIDGKADPKTWFDLFAMAVAAGRADDFLVLNFVVGAAQQAEYSFYSKEQRELWEEFRAVESNTFNIFGTGNSDTLFEIGASLLGSEASGENKMWVERAEALLRSLLKGLTDLRDKGRIKISVKSLQEFMSLEKLSELENDPDIEKTAREQISAVLNEIPGYRDAMSIDDPQQRSMALADQPSKQFGFLLMQFSALFAMLIGTYGHIANVQYSDIYFPDIVYGRRILLCQLPALEKSPNTMSQLGRMALSGIKSALSQSISGTLTGRKADIVDRRPTNSLRAMLLIYDEAGSYLQAGTADVASQARSLGVFNIFSGQEWASFKSATELEAQRIISNSGLKVVLKTEDKETCDEFINAVGETQILRSGGRRNENGRWVEDQRQLEKVPRVTNSQIANLAEGQAFLKWRDTLVPLRMPHVEPKAVVSAQRNDLVPIPGSMVSDRDKLRQHRVITEAIIEETKPPLNLVAECRTGLDNSNDEAESDSWRLMERLVRYAHEHQVILPWEESPPPQGRLHAGEMYALEPERGARALEYMLLYSTEEHDLLKRARAIVDTGRPATPPYNPQEMALEYPDDDDSSDDEDSATPDDLDEVSRRVDSLMGLGDDDDLIEDADEDSDTDSDDEKDTQEEGNTHGTDAEDESDAEGDIEDQPINTGAIHTNALDLFFTPQTPTTDLPAQAVAAEYNEKPASNSQDENEEQHETKEPADTEQYPGNEPEQDNLDTDEGVSIAAVESHMSAAASFEDAYDNDDEYENDDDYEYEDADDPVRQHEDNEADTPSVNKPHESDSNTTTTDEDTQPDQATPSTTEAPADSKHAPTGDVTNESIKNALDLIDESQPKLKSRKPLSDLD